MGYLKYVFNVFISKYLGWYRDLLGIRNVVCREKFYLIDGLVVSVVIFL